MSDTHGAWEAPVVNAIPTEKLRYGSLPPVDDPRDLFVLHAVLLHTGKVLMFSGHTEAMYYAPVSYVFDPDTGSLTRVEFPGDMDLFCCHYVQLEDGRVLVVGGSEPDFVTHSSRGAKNIVIFDPTKGTAGEWEKTDEDLIQGRWYPTAVILGDGRVVVVSGRREPGVTVPPANIADQVEVLVPPKFTPKLLGSKELQLPIYPGLHLAPDGRVYYTNTNWGQQIDNPPTTRALEVVGDTGVWQDTAVAPASPRREEGMSVLLPPAQDGKILVIGGSEARNMSGVGVLRPGGGGTDAFDHIADAADASSAEILTTGASARWDPAPGGGTTLHPRINGHLVLLPDATVLVCGGHNNYKWLAKPATKPSLPAEIFTPGVGFAEAATMTHPRMYHSVALLLPDGRVLVAGGADRNDSEPTLTWPDGWPTDLRWPPGGYALNRKERQLYRPPYFFKGQRPKITGITRDGAATTQTPYGSVFHVTTDVPAANIEAVALMRPGAPTHHTDSEQRYVPLTFSTPGPNTLSVAMLADNQKSVAPPGYYMLWIVDKERRPCERAWFVHVPGPPRPVSSSSCVVATVSMGRSDAPEVLLLRRVRADLTDATAVGRRFVGVVNGLYYSFAPRLAGWLARHDRARAAVRDVVVRPGAAAVRAAERVTAPLRPVGPRHAALMAVLVICALVAVVLCPPALLVHLLARRGEAEDGD